PCCPPNVVRLIASLGSYIYAQDDRDFYVNLFVGSTARLRNLKISQQTQYPWDGSVRITIDPASPQRFAVNLRLPGWAQNQVVDGKLYRFTDSNRAQPLIKLNGRSLFPPI